MEPEIQELINYLIVERGLAAATTTVYAANLEHFAASLKAQGATLGSFERKHVSHYLGTLMVLSKASILQRIASIRSLLNYQLLNGQPREAVLASLPHTKLEQKLPDALNEAQAGEMCWLPDNLAGANTSRDAAILELLYGSGLRSTELRELKCSQIDWANWNLRIVGKGNVERNVPMNTKTAGALKRYLDERPTTADAPLFPMSKMGLWKLVGRYGRKAGIVKTVHPHMLRHAYASHLVSNGADIRHVQELLGHRSINTTAVYVHTDIKRLHETTALLGR